MLSRCFTLYILVISLFELSLAAPSGSCMPCQASNRRVTGWHQKLPTRGVPYNPRITNPTNGTIWSLGSDVTVTWDVRDMPQENATQKGRILLGYLEERSQDEHLDIGHPLALDFNLGDGYATFKCPKVEPRKDYIVVLFGDSGNRSSRFTIKK